MKCPLVLPDVPPDHDPEIYPLTRPAGTLSPSGGEGRGEGVFWFMERGTG